MCLLMIHSNLATVDRFGIFDPKFEIILVENSNHGLCIDISTLPLVDIMNLYLNQIIFHNHTLGQLS